MADDVEQALQETLDAEYQTAQAPVKMEAGKSRLPSGYVALMMATAIAELLLVGAIAGGEPHGYYTLVRLTLCSVLAFLAFRFYAERRAAAAVLLGFAALVYNPLLPIGLPRPDWETINMLTIPSIAVALFLLRPSRKP